MDIFNEVKNIIGKRGFEFEVYTSRSKNLKIEINDKEIDNIQASDEFGIGLRVLKDKKIGFAYTTFPSKEAISLIVEQAIEMAELSEEDEGNIFLETREKPSCELKKDEEGLSIPSDEKLKLLIDIENKIKSKDKRIAYVRDLSFSQSESEISLKNSYGVDIYLESSHFGISASAIASSNSDNTIAWDFDVQKKYKDLKIDDIIQTISYKAINLLEPKEFKTKNIDIIFFRDTFAFLINTFSSIFSGEALLKNKTLLKGKENEKIGSDILTLIDDPTLDISPSQTPFDADGKSTKRNILIENGIFKGFLHNLYTAKKLSTNSTSNSVRSGYKSLPSVSILSAYIVEGSSSFEKLLEKTDECVVILELMGLHTADPISGNFSLGASGLYYKNGKLLNSVRGITVAGNILDIFSKIVDISNDKRYYFNVGGSSVLINNVTIGGS